MKKVLTEEEILIKKEILRLRAIEYRKNNSEKVKESRKKWVDKNPIKNNNIKKKCDEKYRGKKENKEKAKKYREEYYEINKKDMLENNKEWREANPEKVKENNRKYIESNSEKIAIYKENNKERDKKVNKKWKKERILIDTQFRLTCNIKSMIANIFKNNGYQKNGKRTHDILGCSYELFINHIESQWSLPHNLDENCQIWMNWGNYGKYKKKTKYFGWDIDHRIPTSSTKTEEELLELSHHTNLQPLCSYTNRYIKRNKLDWDNSNLLRIS